VRCWKRPCGRHLVGAAASGGASLSRAQAHSYDQPWPRQRQVTTKKGYDLCRKAEFLNAKAVR